MEDSTVISLAGYNSYDLLQCDLFTLYLEIYSFRDTNKAGYVLGYQVPADQWFRTTLTVDLDALFPDRRPVDNLDISFPHMTDSAFVKHNGRLLMLLAERSLLYYNATHAIKVVEVLPVSRHCSIFHDISVMPEHLSNQQGDVLVAAGSNAFVVSFMPCTENDHVLTPEHIVVYDISKNVWYPLRLPRDDM